MEINSVRCWFAVIFITFALSGCKWWSAKSAPFANPQSKNPNEQTAEPSGSSATPNLSGSSDDIDPPAVCTDSGLTPIQDAGDTSAAEINDEIKQLNTPVVSRVRGSIKGPELVQAMRARASRIRERVRRDPRFLFKARLDRTFLGRLPSAAAQCMERDIEDEGEVEILETLRLDGTTDLQYIVRGKKGKKRRLHFAGDTPDLKTGDYIRIHGLGLPMCGTEEEDEAEPTVLQAGTGALEVLQAAAPAASGFGAQNIAVILVSFQDQATSYTQAKAQDVVFNQSHSFFLEASYTQAWATGQVFGPYTIAQSKSGCSSDTLASLANSAAAQDGFSTSQYRRILYVFPTNACAWLGLGTIGGNPSKSWINGSFVLHTVVHELGHNLGLYHSNAYNCGSASIGTSCSSVEYGDTTDIMGNRLPGHFTAFQKERLGWLNYGVSPGIQTVETSGAYEIDPYESTSTNVKALKIHKSTDPSTGKKSYYYVEYRQPGGFDAILANSSTYNLTTGVVIHTGSETTGNSSYLLNMNPQTGSWYKAALNVGQTFEDTTNGISIMLSSATTTGATIGVSFDDAPVVALTTSMNKSAFAGGERVELTLHGVLMAISGSIEGASYSVEIRDPTGTTVVETGTLDANGGAGVSFAIGACPVPGEYTVTSRVAQGTSVATDTAAFSVN